MFTMSIKNWTILNKLILRIYHAEEIVSLSQEMLEKSS